LAAWAGGAAALAGALHAANTASASSDTSAALERM
jgi:hypothetical protein